MRDLLSLMNMVILNGGNEPIVDMPVDAIIANNLKMIWHN